MNTFINIMKSVAFSFLAIIVYLAIGTPFFLMFGGIATMVLCVLAVPVGLFISGYCIDKGWWD